MRAITEWYAGNPETGLDTALASVAAAEKVVWSELEESARKAAYGVGMLERQLSINTWLAGDDYSLADINCFNTTRISASPAPPSSLRELSCSKIERC